MPIADATTTQAIDNLADYNIVANNRCRRIFVQENYDSSTTPTADLIMKMPSTATNGVKIPKGTSAIYTPVGRDFFYPGEIAGTIRTSAGSVTIQKIESDLI